MSAGTPQGTTTQIDTGNLAPSPVVGTAPAPAAAAPAAPAPTTAAVVAAPGEDPEWLAARLERERKKASKELAAKLGIKDPDELAARLKRADELETAAETRRLEQLSEVEREREGRRVAEAALAQMRTEKEAAEANAALVQACHERKIGNAGYARFLVEEARRKDPNADPIAALDAAMLDDQHKIALGVQVPEPRTTPATTTPGMQPPAAPAAGASGNGEVDVTKLDDKSWREYRQKLGLHV